MINIILNYFQCSAMCNGGYEENIPRCVTTEKSIERNFNDEYCNDISRTPLRRLCNTQPCLSRPINVTRRRRRRRWEVDSWSLVSEKKTTKNAFILLMTYSV